MVLMLSAQAVVVAEEEEEKQHFITNLAEFERIYERDINTVESFFECAPGDLPPEDVPLEIQNIVLNLVEEIKSIMPLQPSGPSNPGVNGYWKTLTQYVHHCISLKKVQTTTISWIFWGYYEGVVDHPLLWMGAIIMGFTSIPMSTAFGFCGLFELAPIWNTFYPWILQAGDWNHYGIVWYFNFGLFPVQGYEQYAQPQNFNPSVYHPEWTWIPG